MDSQPILYLDVNIGNDDISRIIVMQSDDPINVAEKFAKDNSKPHYSLISLDLDEKKKAKLIAVIKSQLASMLSKIDEEETD